MKKFPLFSTPGSYSCLLSILMVVALTLPLYSEHVFLKNGAIIEGRVLSDTGEGVTVKKPDGKVEYIKSTRILRTIYWKFSREKSYIKFKAGGMISAYKVDEDINTITLRKKLYVNNEFKIEKNKVQYITNAIPYNLAGQVEGDNIILTWESSLSNIKNFEILVKKEKEKGFTVAGISDYPGYVFKKTEPDVVYVIKVRSVDVKGDISPESNEIKVKIDGTVLPVPEISDYSAHYLENEDDYSLNISVDISPEQAKSVQKYRIFLKEGDSYKVVAESDSKDIKISYSESGLNQDIANTFVIRSVSESGIMSGDSDEFEPLDFMNVKLPRIRLGMGLATLGDSTLKNRYGPGYGVTGDIFLVRYRFKNRYYYSHGFDIGIRGMYRVFKQDDKIFTSVDDPTIWANTMRLYSGDIFFRYSKGFLFLGEHWDLYVSAAPRFLYSRITTLGKPEYTGGDKTYNYKSYGIAGGIGFECTLFKWSGLFVEYNYGYVPLDSDGRNVEGHQVYAGIMMRQ